MRTLKRALRRTCGLLTSDRALCVYGAAFAVYGLAGVSLPIAVANFVGDLMLSPAAQ